MVPYTLTFIGGMATGAAFSVVFIIFMSHFGVVHFCDDENHQRFRFVFDYQSIPRNARWLMLRIKRVNNTAFSEKTVNEALQEMEDNYGRIRKNRSTD